MPNNVKTYDRTGDPEDHVKFFQATTQVERWAMHTWCHMFNSTLIGAARVWFYELLPESIDGYKDLKEDFLAYFMEQKKYVKDPVKIHNIKQRDRETIEEFMKRFKVETRRMKGAPECMRIFRFMHGVNNPELTKRLNEHVPKTMEEMMITTTAFIRGETVAAGKKKGHTSEGRGSSKFTPLTRTPKEILATEAGKFKPPPHMVTPMEKRSSNKFCDFYIDKGHSTDEWERSTKSREKGRISQGQVHGNLYDIAMAYNDKTEDHSTRAWMNFMIVRSLSLYNGIIGRPRIREIQAVPSTAYRMLKFPVDRGIVTIHGTILIPTKYATVITSSKEIPKEARVRHENFKVALHLNFPDQEVAIVERYRERTRQTMSPPEKNLEILCMEAPQITWTGGTAINSGTSTQYPRRVFARSIEEKGPRPGACESHPSGGYHQIQMAESDEEKMAFHTSQWVGRNMEVYVDDLVIKSHTEAEMLRDIDETIRFMISPEGIKPCPDKTEAVLQLPFLSKSAEKSLPLFKSLKKCIKKSNFHWTPEAEQAFKKLKQHLSELPLLVAPKPKEELIVYMSASHGAISAVLMTERGTVQTSIYFIRRHYKPELNYTPMEKLVLSLVFAAKRLRRAAYGCEQCDVALDASKLAVIPKAVAKASRQHRRGANQYTRIEEKYSPMSFVAAHRTMITVKPDGYPFLSLTYGNRDAVIPD
ncbi:reverse transcriptase domain-containing protein [Tanacetum coccineum]